MLDKGKKKKKRKKASSEVEESKEFARSNLDRARMRLLMNNNLLEYARLMSLSKEELDIIEKQFYMVRHRILDTQSKLILAKEVSKFNRSSYLFIFNNSIVRLTTAIGWICLKYDICIRSGDSLVICGHFDFGQYRLVLRHVQQICIVVSIQY